jgi:hypothetical protein
LLSLPSSDRFTITGYPGSSSGIAIYAVLDPPSNLKGTEGVGQNDHYFGTFVFGASNPGQSLLYEYAGNPFVNVDNEPTLELFHRPNNAATEWENSDASQNSNLDNLTSEGPAGEWILGSSGIPLPNKEIVPLSETPVIYPNPATDRICFRGLTTETRFRVLDAAGREVRSGFLQPTNESEIRLIGLNRGLYLVHLEARGFRTSVKLILR